MFCSGSPNEQNIAHQTPEQENCLSSLIECLMAFKPYQTQPNMIKHQQTRWPNKLYLMVFGHFPFGQALTVL